MSEVWKIADDILTLAILGVTVWAILRGPVKAVEVSEHAAHKREEVREKRRRQYNILHSLMRTRAIVLHADHVAAINLVQLEFYGHDRVQEAFRRYREHLDVNSPDDPVGRERWFDDRRDRFYTMVKEMADVLGYSFDKSDLRKLAYTPQGWADSEAQMLALRAQLIEMFEGKRPIPITQWHPNTRNSKFPPPPGSAQAAIVLPAPLDET